MSIWVLPESLADILPSEARRIEELRRKLLDLYRSYGYELVAPPLVEYLDSLLSGTGSDLGLRTCTLVDQLSGRTLGVRADITPQTSRIDAHLLNRAGITRLCYCGSVLHARPADLVSDRELIQIGAELYGHADVQADLEIIRLAFESVRQADVTQARLDLNHPGVLNALLASDPALQGLQEELSLLMGSKDIPGIEALCRATPDMAAAMVDILCVLPTLYGEPDEVLTRARQVLPPLPSIERALADLQVLVQALSVQEVSLDLADKGSGYAYHSGVMFSIYAQGWHDALVRGGRYDGISKVFGRERAATGFSLDLRKVSAGLPAVPLTRAVRAPWADGVHDAALELAVQQLRQRGEVVIQFAPGDAPHSDEFLIDRELVWRDGNWQLAAVV